ncbi:MAG: M23 family metallopeptidase [Alphaproteobacteria bacterium]|nr:MAG: M23 family metallopeptidase [Alphaproteobacteria bacterium]
MGLIKIVALTAMLAPLAGIGVIAWQDYSDSGISGRTPVKRSSSTSHMFAQAPLRPSRPLVIPVKGVVASQLADTFDEARSAGRVHDAIDIMAPRGTPVLAAAPGRIEKLFQSRDGGNTVYLRSPDGRTVHYYAHLDAYAPGIREGASVGQGTMLGTVGSTGNASLEAPHLHFEIVVTQPSAKWWESGRVVNPYPLLVGGA